MFSSIKSLLLTNHLRTIRLWRDAVWLFISQIILNEQTSNLRAVCPCHQSGYIQPVSDFYWTVRKWCTFRKHDDMQFLWYFSLFQWNFEIVFFFSYMRKRHKIFQNLYDFIFKHVLLASNKKISSKSYFNQKFPLFVYGPGLV